MRIHHSVLNSLQFNKKSLPLELSSIGHLAEVAPALRMTQQRLGRQHDQRLAERQRNLAPQQMEVVAGGGAVRHDPVDVVQLPDGKLLRLGREVVGIVRAHLQEPLDAGRRMLRTHALHAVGQQHHQTALAHPFRLAGRHELVDNALRGVVEVAELRLPADERVRVGHRVAELESEHKVANWF